MKQPEKDTKHGRLIMVYGVPKMRKRLALRGAGQRINLTGVLPCGEKTAAHLEIVPHGNGMKIKSLYVGGDYRERSISSALVTYLKTYKKDIYAPGGIKHEEFSRRLGFSRERGLWMLPAGAPLRKREFELKSRKFYISPYRTDKTAQRFKR